MKMEKLRMFKMTKLRLFLVFVVFGCSGGFVAAKLSALGLFEKWVYLGAPPDGGVEILDSYGSEIIVRSANGQVYSCSTRPGRSCWKTIEWPPQVTGYRELIKFGHFWIVNTPENAIDSIKVAYYPGVEDYAEAKYVLLNDGSVWGWQYSIHDTDMWTWIYVYSPFICSGILGGVILGLVDHP